MMSFIMPIKSITRFMSLAALFLVPFFSLIVANSFFFPFITGKAFYFRALVEIAFASWVVLAFLDAKYRPKLNALTVGITVFALVTLVADLLGVNPIRSLWSNFERMEGWITVVHLWMFFMVASGVLGAMSSDGPEGKKLWHRWMNVELAVALLVAGYGLFQLFGWAAIHQGSSRIDASLGNAAYMAVYMLLNAGIAVYLFCESNLKARWVYVVLAVLFSFELYETATRGTILGLVGGIMVALAAYAVFARNKSTNGVAGANGTSGQPAISRSRWISGSIVAVVVVLILAFIGLRHQPFIENNPVLGRLASISLSSSETTARLYIWQSALTGWSQRPVLGWGQENFNYIFNANYNPAMWSQEQWFDRAHSVYLDWLTASGVVGLISYLALYVLFLFAVWKSTLTVAEKSALTGLLAGYAIHNIFVFDNLASYVLFFALLAFAASLAGKMPASPGASAGASSMMPKILGGTRAIGAEVIEYVVAPAAIIVLIAGLYWFTWRPIQENTRLIAALISCSGSSSGSLPDPSFFQNALDVGAYVGDQEIREQLLSCAGSVIPSQAVPDPTKQAFFTLAMDAIAAQVAATPKDARIYTLAGSFLDQVGAFSQAEPILIDAHLLSPAKQTIDFELGNDYINEGKISQAVEIFKQAYESATDDTDARTGYATVLVIAGQDAQAHALFGDDPSLFETPGMAQAYAAAREYPKAIAIYQSLIGTSTDNIDLQLKLAQTQYAAGMVSAAVATLKLIEKNHPEYTTQLDAAIQQAETGK